MRVLDAFVARLEAQGLGTAGTTIFAGSDVDLPSEGSALLTLVETGGRAAVGTHADPIAIRQPSLQLTARADLYQDAVTLLDQAIDALTVTNLTIGDLFFLWIRPLQSPLNLPIDAQGRVRVATNFASAVRRAA